MPKWPGRRADSLLPWSSSWFSVSVFRGVSRQESADLVSSPDRTTSMWPRASSVGTTQMMRVSTEPGSSELRRTGVGSPSVGDGLAGEGFSVVAETASVVATDDVVSRSYFTTGCGPGTAHASPRFRGTTLRSEPATLKAPVPIRPT
jgi:hypothetical protein